MGATLVPMAVPISYMNIFVQNSKMFHVRTNVSNVIRNSVGIVWSSLSSNASFIHAMPSLCGILLYSPTTSIDMGKQFSGSSCFFNSSKCLRKSGVSCRYDGIFLTRFLVCVSTKRLTFSVIEIVYSVVLNSKYRWRVCFFNICDEIKFVSSKCSN